MRRSKVAIIYEVLGIMIRNGGEASTSQISLEANLAYDRMMKLLEELEEKGLVEIREAKGRKIVFITSKGRELYMHLARVKGILSDFGISI